MSVPAEQAERRPARQWPTSLKRGLPIAIITILPLTRNSDLWSNVWKGARPRAWDGTGHFALAQIYNQSIFPDTLGWTQAYFAGMPFPNFYPPLFYWGVALLSHTHLIPFATAFKLVLIIPVLLLPAAIWVLAYTLSERDRIVANVAAIAILPMLIDYHLLHPVGLNHQGTFLIGLYSQPLGFVLLIAWYVVYTRPHHHLWRFTLAAILLTLTVLANFFTAITAAHRHPLYSHLKLTKTEGDPENDGLLEAREIMNLNLPADLAVLSACETANGKIAPGEGVIGMSWAFFIAGTRSLLVSQWKVNSASTLHLMVNFYREFVGEKALAENKKAGALQRAKQRTMKEPRFRHPFYWAGFVLVGNTN